MPIYEFSCEHCHSRISEFFNSCEQSYSPVLCPICNKQMTRQFPLPRVNVFNEHFEPAHHTKFNWNPERAMSEVPGGGAEYARTYTEHRKGHSRWDINGDPNIPNIPTELSGTIEDQRRKGKFNVRKQNQNS